MFKKKLGGFYFWKFCVAGYLCECANITSHPLAGPVINIQREQLKFTYYVKTCIINFIIDFNIYS